MDDVQDAQPILNDTLVAILHLKEQVAARYASNRQPLDHVFALAIDLVRREASFLDCAVPGSESPCRDELERAAFASQFRDVVHQAVREADALDTDDGKWVAGWMDDIHMDVTTDRWAQAQTVAPELLPLLALEACVVNALGGLQFVGGNTFVATFCGVTIQAAPVCYPSWDLLARVARGCVDVLRIAFSLDDVRTSENGND